MQTSRRCIRAIVLATAALLPLGAAGTAYAQVPSPPAPPGANLNGTVRMFTLTPRGDVDGVILDNGTEVHTPPHLSPLMTAAVRPGDQVRVQGWSSATPGVVAATAVTDTRDGQNVVDQGPPPPGTMPPPPPPGVPTPGVQSGSAQGQVQQVLHGPTGDVNGALLTDGTQLRMPPPAAYQVAAMLQPGQTVAAQGYVLSTPYGRVMDVQALGPSLDRLVQVAPAPGAFPPPPPPGSPGAPPPPAPGMMSPPPPPGVPGPAPQR